MIRTGADGRLEHAAAYLISGLAVFTAYPRRLKWLIAILMMCYAGILEFGQLWAPVATRGFWIGQQAPVACYARSCCMTPINEFMRRLATPKHETARLCSQNAGGSHVIRLLTYLSSNLGPSLAEL